MWFSSPAAAAATWLAATPTERLGFALFFFGAALVLLAVVLRLARRPAAVRAPRAGGRSTPPGRPPR